MLARKWLLTTFICSGLLGVGTFGHNVDAAEILQPNSDWAISTLSASRSGGKPYCALARRFTNNSILTVARNANDESSIAVDFQKPALDNLQNYNVTLNPGFEQNRSFNIRPVSGKALVVRLGKDYPFYDAMNRSDKLDIQIAGESFSFNLPGFDEGQKKLVGCLANIVEPTAGSESALKPGVIQASAEAPSQLTEPEPRAQAPVFSKVSGVGEGDIQALSEENTKLRNALEHERRVYEDRLLQESQNGSMAAELKEKLNLLEAENARLRNNGSGQEIFALPVEEDASASVLEETGKELVILRTENQRLKESLAAKQDASGQNNVSDEGEIAALRAANQTLKQELEVQKAQYALLEKQLATKDHPETPNIEIMARLRDRVKILEEENNNLKASASASSDTFGAGTVSLAQIKSLEEQLRYVQEDRDKLLGQLDNLARGKGQDRLDISTDNWNLEQATRRFNESEDEIRRLGRQLEEARMKCAMEKKELEYMLFDPDVATEEQISKLMELESQNKAYQNKISVIELENAEYEQKLAYQERIPAPGSGHSIRAQKQENIAITMDQVSPAAGQIETQVSVVAEPAEFLSAEREEISIQKEDIASYQSFTESAERAAIVTPTVGLMSKTTLNTILERAHIPVQGDITLVQEAGASPDFVAYSWDTGALFGSAEQQPMENSGKFDGLIHSYLDKTKDRCQGDFASVHGMTGAEGTMQLSTYEIACINGQGGASASIVFYNDGNLFTVIAHETGLDAMDVAMDAKDKLAEMLLHSKIVSN
ncbi:MAG: hypothetical protein CO093_07660 [Alphaproteobacteria bacterium CG_4_9_14_3_um_filter_47_13]|nr:MAG: hypothetical protein CO093_07660 [Alphaproteobacteria bacterium CG_4_9_14_3_um_filter_47_13]